MRFFLVKSGPNSAKEGELKKMPLNTNSIETRTSALLPSSMLSSNAPSSCEKRQNASLQCYIIPSGFDNKTTCEHLSMISFSNFLLLVGKFLGMFLINE
jgi:hypothetical protein